MRPAWPFASGLLGLFPQIRLLAEQDVRHLPRPAPGDRLVDVGCGSGAFVRRPAALGYAAEGLEFDPEAVGAARKAGLDVCQGSLPDTGLLAET